MSQTIAAPKKGKMDRLLGAMRMGSSKQADAGSGGALASETLTFKTDDLVPKLNAKTQTIKLTGSLRLELNVVLTGKLAKADSTNELFRTDAKKVADGWFSAEIDELVANMQRVIADVDSGGTAKEIAAFQKVFEATCQAESARLSVKFEAKMMDYLASNKAIKAAYTTYKIKVVSSIIQNVAIVITSIVVTGVTWGATGPIAVVAIVRSCAGIGVQIYQLAIGTDRVIKDIENTLNVLGKLMIQVDKDTENKGSAIAANTSFEVALGAASGVLGIPLPSVTTLGEQIDLLHTNLQRMHGERLAMGEEMSKLTGELKAYVAKIAEHEKVADPNRKMLEKHKGYVEGFKAQHEKLTTNAELAFVNIVAVLARHKEFEDQLKLYKASQKSWSRQSKLVFGLMTSIGLSVGSADSGLEKGLGAMNEILAVAKDKLFEYV